MVTILNRLTDRLHCGKFMGSYNYNHPRSCVVDGSLTGDVNRDGFSP